MLRHAHVSNSRSYLPGIPDGRYRIEERDNTVVLTPDPDTGPPYRFVDRYQRGWLTLAPDRCSVYPALDDNGEARDEWPFDRVVAERGPIRPVVGYTDQDEEILLHLARCAQRAVPTTVNVLGRFYEKARAQDGHPYRLTAGRPGSWESQGLLNLAAVGSDVPRAEIDDVLVLPLTLMFDRWMFAEESFVEVAENLAGLFGQLGDVLGGWNAITTQRFRRSPLAPAAQALFASRIPSSF